MIEILEIIDGLPFVSVSIIHNGMSIETDRVLVDTGSVSSIFKVDLLEKIGIQPESEDIIVSISGIGGSECVYLKKIDSIVLGEIEIKEFTVDLGVMDYGFDIDGIIGMNLLQHINSIINIEKKTISGHI